MPPLYGSQILSELLPVGSEPHARGLDTGKDEAASEVFGCNWLKFSDFLIEIMTTEGSMKVFDLSPGKGRESGEGGVNPGN